MNFINVALLLFLSLAALVTVGSAGPLDYVTESCGNQWSESDCKRCCNKKGFYTASAKHYINSVGSRVCDCVGQKRY